MMDKITALAKRRGFVFPGSEIYGGLANTYDYGPLGSELKRNIEQLWWDFFVTKRENIFGLETSVLMNPKVWEASGHTENFSDVMVDCKNCQLRTRLDHLIEDYFEKKDEVKKVEGLPIEELEKIVNDNKINCPACGKFNWTKAREINTLFETEIGIITGEKNKAYLRGETAQGMFVDFKQVLDSMSPKLPFGLAQSGLAFRNEITKGNFTFRTLEFHLAEFEYYIKESEWEETFEYWKEEIEKFSLFLGLNKEKLRWREHTKDELSHYSKRTEDLDFNFPFGFKEMFAIAYRTDFDLKNHMEKSGVNLRYIDPETGDKFIPHVIEPTFGITRAVLAILVNGYTEEEKRTYLKLDPKVAPYKAAVFPLLANKDQLVDKARELYEELLCKFNVAWDDRGNIGKRYFAQDEIGTPWCITVDFDTLEDDAITIRDRDTTNQERVSLSKVENWLSEKLQKDC